MTRDAGNGPTPYPLRTDERRGKDADDGESSGLEHGGDAFRKRRTKLVRRLSSPVRRRTGTARLTPDDRRTAMIRERRGKRGAGCLQVISVRYDSAIGRNRQRVVATLPLDADGLPSRVVPELTETERRNAEAFFAARSHELRERRILESVAALVVQGHRIRTALADPGDRPMVLRAAELYGLGTSLAELVGAAVTAGLRGRIRVAARRR